MSNEELEKYKEIHSRLVEQFVLLHNKNQHFIHWSESENIGFQIRSVLREIQKITRELHKQTKLVRIEGINNLKELKRQQREVKKQKGSYRKRKKPNDNNRPTSRSI